ncbi:MAG: hypothetical protein IPM29_04900 [Planctomycetes bacterium]|nr:hypothetical protein [Planctomycetota bacterium]
MLRTLAWLVSVTSALPLLAQQHPKLESWQERRALDASSPFAALQWRAVGPRFCGGRVESIAVPRQSPYTIYVAPGSGNLWKTTNGGMSWTPLFEHEATCAIGHVEVAPSDPEVVWLGTGEAHLGGMSYDGAGVYRSTDGGATWTYAGLAEVDRIGKVRVHRSDPDTAWVAAIGPHRGTPSSARGVYRTRDGGKTWEHTLATGANVAAIDLVLAPDDPDRLYCATWDRGGGHGSGVHRSTDGGSTWQRLAGGLPLGPQIERVAVDVSASRPRTVYALTVDASKPGEGRYGVGGVVYRSDDDGDTWRRCHAGFLPAYVGWDFCDVKVAPDDPDQLFVCGMKLMRSTDGGATWQLAGEHVQRVLPFHARDMDVGRVLHLDAHDLWIDPVRPDRLLLGNDGGLFESLDRGSTWLHLNLLPIAEFYTVHVDPEVRSDEDAPYRIYGGTQDNASVYGPARAIDPFGPDPWRHVFLDRWAGGDGFVTLPDPTEPGVVYFEHQNGDMRRKRLDGPIESGRGDRGIRPRGDDLQFAWNTPLLISHHAPARLYCAAQHVFRTIDRGDSWTRIGDDLGNGRPIVSLAESPMQEGTLYAGSASDRIHVTVDDGATWQRAAALPPGRLARIVASRHAAERVFACAAGRGGPAAIVMTSTDRGASWHPIDAGLPKEDVNVLLEDPRDPRVLYVGTDRGVCVSRDSGASWESLSTTLPTVPVLDLAFQPQALELVAATHGRGVFALDVSSVEPRD